ncbi:unnamed protein product [Cylicocyclus nassatus]|uniref:Uncharacterized protein n=1 Tax=Cylicocyclus nassatus TaxID=53992 RepID=A0AA36GKV8_CYLNA|nr:unnamed protein product [Cylicocyclus nassatus]
MAPVRREITNQTLEQVGGIPKMQERTGKKSFHGFQRVSLQISSCHSDFTLSFTIAEKCNAFAKAAFHLWSPHLLEVSAFLLIDS